MALFKNCIKTRNITEIEDKKCYLKFYACLHLVIQSDWTILLLNPAGQRQYFIIHYPNRVGPDIWSNPILLTEVCRFLLKHLSVSFTQFWDKSCKIAFYLVSLPPPPSPTFYYPSYFFANTNTSLDHRMIYAWDRISL